MNDYSEPDTHLEVQRYYGETLGTSDDLKTTACCTAAPPPAHLTRLLADVHEEVLAKYYGCGLVLPESLEGLRVLDLGCGAGRDVYILSRLVGPKGKVVGVDMTPAQLEVAERHRDWHAERYGYEQSNVEFIEANIEALEKAGLDEGSFDLIVSNCVINLAVDKAAVLESAFRLLSPGGEMYFSDIYANRRVPAELARDPVLYGECLSGAMYWGDFRELARTSGFADPRLLEHEQVDVTDPDIQSRLGGLLFRSATVRLFRLPGMESGQENYGQTATYLGTVDNHPERFRLDAEQQFEAGQSLPVSGNTATILSKTRFYEHFDVKGDNIKHLGAFGDSGTEDLFTIVPHAAVSKSCC